MGDLTVSDEVQPQATRGSSNVERLFRICQSFQVAGDVIMIDELRWLFVLMVGDMHRALVGSRVSFSKAHEEEI